MELTELMKIKKKRGRKSKKELELLEKYAHLIVNQSIKDKPKKRGRKPKGGKIISNKLLDEQSQNELKSENVIVHLKCNTTEFLQSIQSKTIGIDESSSKMVYNPNLEDVKAYEESGLEYQMLDTHNSKDTSESHKVEKSIIITQEVKTNDSSIKEINAKLKELKMKLHTNDVNDKLSPCFHCTESFDNLPVHIPKYELNGRYEVYGCFCQPECAAAYLFRENIDDSTKWERYALLNSLYKDVYQYKNNFKTAPNPFYTLDKYMGNLTIEEYRNLTRQPKKILIVDKPLTKILPELHEENNDVPSFKSSLKNYEQDEKKEYKLYRKKEKRVANKSSMWKV
jgi:hypothetical protein